jgi:hypothetical protein
MSWHETAARKLSQQDPDPASVYELLEHAAIGLLHQPAGQDTPGHLALLYVDQALGELAAAGAAAPAPMDVGAERVHCGDVRRLLAAAATLLPHCLQGRDGMDQLAYARAAVLVHQARDALPRG